ncbi:hypothetical protein GGR51DRAFT_503728 [Nemania sp. FL0031]|nr:hypothetical protein GGR51DRAFT_503728 [Nemania sp. FL0031]
MTRTLTCIFFICKATKSSSMTYSINEQVIGQPEDNKLDALAFMVRPTPCRQMNMTRRFADFVHFLLSLGNTIVAGLQPKVIISSKKDVAICVGFI